MTFSTVLAPIVLLGGLFIPKQEWRLRDFPAYLLLEHSFRRDKYATNIDVPVKINILFILLSLSPPSRPD